MKEGWNFNEQRVNRKNLVKEEQIAQIMGKKKRNEISKMNIKIKEHQQSLEKLAKLIVAASPKK